MKQVTPSVHIIAKTQVLHNEVQNWLVDKGVEYNYELEASSGAQLVTLAGKRCYMSYQVGAQNRNLTKIRTDMAAFCENILNTAHGSVLEHVNYTFAIENVSRIFTAEFNRHRAGVGVSEGSLRFIRPEEFSYWIPDSIKEQTFLEYREANNIPHSNYTQSDYEQWLDHEWKKDKSRQVFQRAFDQMECNYYDLEQIWNIDHIKDFHTKKTLTSMFRRVIGMGIATGGVWTGNIRALRHIFTMRIDEAAEEEICHVATLMLEAIRQHEPELFADFELIDGYYEPTYVKV